MENRTVQSCQRRPYLSVAIYSRNDNHNGDMYQRMQTTIPGLLAQAERHRLRMELILVDYNPPSNKPLLKDALSWPAKSEWCTVRVVVVPSSIHQRYRYADLIPVHGPLAYNTAVRRAHGDFVLVTGVDMLFTDELMDFLAAEKLDPGRMYRVDRHDVSRGALEIDTLDEQLTYCHANVVRVNGNDQEGQYWDETSVPRLHTNAAGDFILLSRERWHEMQGYPEDEITGLYADGLLCYSAYLSGAAEEVLRDPMRIYHIDHDSLWRRPRRQFFEPLFSKTGLPRGIGRKADALVNALLPTKGEFDNRGLPLPPYVEFRNIVREMIDGKRPTRFNDEDWGLGNEELPEYDVLPIPQE